jgi:hypothetical protein
MDSEDLTERPAVDPVTAASIASLTLIARLFRWQIAAVLIVGVLSVALAGWAVYSYYGGQKCQSTVFGKLPFPKELMEVTTPSLSTLTKPTDQLTDGERRAKALWDEWLGQTGGPLAECKEQWSAWRWFSMIDPIPPAYAQTKIVGYGPDEVRLMVVIAIFSTLALFFFVCVGALLFSTTPAVITFAADSVKSLLGFFIGVGMSFMGIGK